MKRVLVVSVFSLFAFGALANHGDDSLKYRVDQDAVTYIASNMMYGNNCEYQLNSRASRYDVDTDGIVKNDDDWMDILNTLCDHRMGFSTIF